MFSKLPGDRYQEAGLHSHILDLISGPGGPSAREEGWGSAFQSAYQVTANFGLIRETVTLFPVQVGGGGGLLAESPALLGHHTCWSPGVAFLTPENKAQEVGASCVPPRAQGLRQGLRSLLIPVILKVPQSPLGTSLGVSPT